MYVRSHWGALAESAGERDENAQPKKSRNVSLRPHTFATLSPVPPEVEPYLIRGEMYLIRHSR